MSGVIYQNIKKLCSDVFSRKETLRFMLDSMPNFACRLSLRSTPSEFDYFQHVEFLQSILRCKIRQWRSAFRRIRSKGEIFGCVAIPSHRTHSPNFQLLLVVLYFITSHSLETHLNAFNFFLSLFLYI